MLSIQYLHVTPKCVFCSNIEVSAHLDFKDTQYPSRTPLKYENGRYCSFRQKYFGHWSDALNSDQRKNLITDQKYSLITVRTNTMLLIEENLGLATGFSEVGAALARSPNLEAIEDILKEKGCQGSSHQGRCQNVIISIFESCDSIPILSRIKPSMTLRGSQREFHSRQNVIIPIIRWLYLIIPI